MKKVHWESPARGRGPQQPRAAPIRPPPLPPAARSRRRRQCCTPRRRWRRGDRVPRTTAASSETAEAMARFPPTPTRSTATTLRRPGSYWRGFCGEAALRPCPTCPPPRPPLRTQSTSTRRSARTRRSPPRASFQAAAQAPLDPAAEAPLNPAAEAQRLPPSSTAPWNQRLQPQSAAYLPF